MKYRLAWTCAAWVVVSLLISLTAEGGEGQADLDKAIQLRIEAKTLQQLSEVASLCESAIKKGLDSDSETLAKQMLTVALHGRTQQLAEAIFGKAQPNPQWPLLRRILLIDLDKLLKYDDSRVEAYLLVAKLQILPNGDRAKARSAVDKVVVLLKKNADNKLLAEALRIRSNLRQTDSARLADLNQSIDLDPENVDSLEMRAVYYRRKGEFKKAVDDLKRVLDRQPDNVNIRLAVAETLLRIDQFDEALRQINQVLVKGPAIAALALRGQLYARQDKTKEAIADLDKVLQQVPGDLAARMLRAQLYYTEGRNALAAEDIALVRKARPDVPQAQALDALIQAAQDNLKEAIDIMQTLVKSDPKEIIWQLQLATLFNANDQPEKAIALYTDVLKSSPDQADANRGRADAYLSIGKHKEAIADYNVAIKTRPDDVNILNNLAWVLATSPDTNVRDGKRAIELARKACKNTEYQLSYVLSTLAAAYAETGDFQSAVKWARKAVELADDSIRDHVDKELKSYEKKQPWREQKDAKPAKPKAGKSTDKPTAESPKS